MNAVTDYEALAAYRRAVSEVYACWYCPLAPSKNWLTVPNLADELRYIGE
jgi:hypothetical protein